VSNFSGVAFVVHEKEVEFPDVADQELFQTVWQKMSRLLVATITNLGHGCLALEATSDPVINTLGFSPCLLHSMVTIGLVALEMLGALLDDRDLDGHCGRWLR